MEPTNNELTHSEHSGRQADLSLQIPSNNELTQSEHSGRRADLSLQIPPRQICFSTNLNRKGPPQSLGSSQGSSSASGSLRGLTFKNQAPMPNERSPLLNSDSTPRPDLAIPENASLASYIAALTWKRCVSLPVTPASNLSPSISSSAREPTRNDQPPSYRQTIPAKVPRSLSVPVRNVVILRTGSFATPKEQTGMDTSDGLISPAHLEDGDEEIPEKDACCRICLDELCGGGTSLKLECSCKGDLRLMHEECAMKWFSRRNNNKCDVCGQEILNLPVTLFRMQSSTQNDNIPHHIRRNSNSQLTRAWQDVVVLILISTMCYFFFLEQLLVIDLKSQAIMIAAPFSFSLGLLSSLFAIVLACREYVWAYSAFQFCLVVSFLHIFYTMIEVPAVYAVLFAALMAFGIAMSVNSLVLRIFARRAQLVRTQTNLSPV
ncbi:uncharacterized protein LOC131224718 isoform X2 [Magnolia sinica]|nr:uncharacterized protein LOC131224718 isoform X2 [Magnolia sinica]XP_058076014.1 uncharacterized protein LOC131224718 isoform X2 [Magnolia sinica]